jgi:hypothetical protein
MKRLVRELASPPLDVIQTNDNLQVRYWAQRLGVSCNALRLAVQAVGRDPEEVERFIRQSPERSLVDGEDLPTAPAAAPGRSLGDGGSKARTDGEGELLRLQYVSRVAPDLAADAVQTIASRSVAFNARADVTGVLIFTGTHFSQILEGPPAAVQRLMESIRRDSRHRDVRMLYESAISKRRFADWSMALMQDAGLNDLIEELWWAHRLDGARAARLVQHLWYGLQCESGEARVAKQPSRAATTRPPDAAS